MKKKKQDETDEQSVTEENIEPPKKKKKGWRIALLVLGILLTAIIIPVIVVTTMFVVKYRSISYEYQKPVAREDEYVMPEYPDVTPIPDGVDPDALIPGEENVPEEKDEEPEEEPPTDENGTPQAQWTGEVLPSTVNTSTHTPNYNTSASFANSPNAVSVYTGIPIYQVKRKNADIQNFLVMGTDSRDVTMERGRSDVMMVASYNNKTGSVKLTSLLRDSFVPIEGHGWNRLNTAYAFGGVGLTVNTINQIYGLDIQDFIIVDFNGVKDFIDYLGGVDVYLTQAEVNYYGWSGMREGVNHLNKDQALTHMRNRHLDSDFGRTRRQRDVITAVLKEVSQKSLTDIYDITDYAFSLMKTNISALSMASLAASVLSNSSNLNVQTQNVPYADSFQNVYYGSIGAVLSFDLGTAASRIHSFIYQ